ncbi:MAG TPA: hypothetical protein VEZ11_18145 [Thermoanaerobaculia bacterium]|nr:hypothetical protein [Thermoanaerobaculia bacterium]
MIIIALLAAASASAQSGLTGYWTGTYSTSIQVSNCQNKTFTSSGNVAVTFLQTGTSLLGRMDRTNVLVFNGNCTPTNQEITRAIVGLVNGTSVVWAHPNDSNGTQFNGNVDGDNLTVQLSNNFGGSGTVTLSRAAATPPAADITGSWSGTFSLTDHCANGGTQAYAGALTLGLTQTGSSAAGVLTMQNVPLYDQNCNKLATLTMSLATAGTVSGSTFTGGVFDPSGSFEFPISVTIGNGTLSGTVSGASLTSTAGTFNLTRSSTATPASDFAGTYSGSYSETDNDGLFCFNVGALSYGDAASLSLVQSGNDVSGALVFQNPLQISSDGFGNCLIFSVSQEVLPLYGTLSGSTLNLTTPLGGSVAQFAVTFGSNSVSGTILDSFGDQASFDATRTSAGAPPTVSTFKASPAEIVTGESTTLTWSTSNATSVSIDNGLGSQPASGSVTVTPTQTTTYTLTATGPTDTATATAKVTVVPPGPRRRSAHP